jgi:ABC-type uncharacterized transport system substrate-binding protein
MFRCLRVVPLCLFLLSFGFAADARQQKRTWRVGYLAALSIAADTPRLTAFRQGLRDLGYVEGRDIVIDYRQESRGFEPLSALAAEVVAQEPDVLVAVTTNAPSGLPSICARSDYANNGCMMSYGPSYAIEGRDGARIVDRILRGAKPSDIPVEQPMQFELIINLETARKLGVTILPSVLYLADRLIEGDRRLERRRRD